MTEEERLEKLKIAKARRDRYKKKLEEYKKFKTQLNAVNFKLLNASCELANAKSTLSSNSDSKIGKQNEGKIEGTKGKIDTTIRSISGFMNKADEKIEELTIYLTASEADVRRYS